MYKYYLPDENGNPQIHTNTSNSLILIGANGSGKSKLGAWMEQNDLENIHRISAQRSLVFGDYIQLRSYEQSKNLLFYGEETTANKGYRWEWGKYTTKLLTDYEFALSALIAKKNQEHDLFVEKCKLYKYNNVAHMEVPYTDLDRLYEIWNDIFPHRSICLNDAKVMASLVNTNGEKNEYKGNEMSDGERVALYLISQCLSIPEGKTVIIDEPEIHLHRLIINRLWNKIEEMRKDCLFVYITHDIEFAAAHRQAKKIWLREYSGGDKWKICDVNSGDLPEDLLLSILGSRKNIIFVEGMSNSLDTQLYSEIYKNYHIIPSNSCTEVINRTKAFQKTTDLHHIKAYGIIDRDYRSDYELEKLKNDSIYAINVAEVENLYIVKEVLEQINTHLRFEDESCITKVIKDVYSRYNQLKNRLICESTVAHLKFTLTTYEISSKTEQAIIDSLDDLFVNINHKDVFAEKFKLFSELEQDDYLQVLKYFNHKGLVNSIGHHFGINNSEYCSLVLRLIRSEERNNLISSLSAYLPKEIPQI